MNVTVKNIRSIHGYLNMVKKEHISLFQLQPITMRMDLLIGLTVSIVKKEDYYVHTEYRRPRQVVLL